MVSWTIDFRDIVLLFTQIIFLWKINRFHVQLRLEVTITPAGGQPIVAKYVPFTQSTDGKQEPKFRLPEGQTLTPGVTYTVTSDWAQIANPSFVAESYAPLNIRTRECANGLLSSPQPSQCPKNGFLN